MQEAAILADRAPDLKELCARYLAAQLKGSRREALRLVVEEGLERGMSVAELQREVLQEAQREIGRLWQENEISIAQEHMATAISHATLAHLYDLADRAPSTNRKVLVACVDGELHDFPARLVADALDLAGFETRYLGASVPLEGLAQLVLSEEPDLIALSITMPFNLPALQAAIARLRVATGGSIPIAVGGGAFRWTDELARELGANITANSAEELVHAANSLFSGVS